MFGFGILLLMLTSSMQFGEFNRIQVFSGFSLNQSYFAHLCNRTDAFSASHLSTIDTENVYLGVWTNHSRGKIMGVTLTMTRQQGNLLIAFTGFLIPFVASRLWKIICVVLHGIFSTSEPRDTVHHQRQVILRNSSPDSALVSLLRLLWAWRKSNKGIKRHFRILSLIVLTAIFISLFVVAGGFSSQISSSAGNEVLLKGGNCGITTESSIFDTTARILAAGRLNDAVNYAQQCYATNNSGILGCDKFVSQKLPTAIWNYNASCPFQADICRSNGTSIHLDTGILTFSTRRSSWRGL